MKIELSNFGTFNIYIPYFGWLSQCHEQFWSAGKYEDGPLEHNFVYPALVDLGLTGFRLNLWEDIIKERFDKLS